MSDISHVKTLPQKTKQTTNQMTPLSRLFMRLIGNEKQYLLNVADEHVLTFALSLTCM